MNNELKNKILELVGVVIDTMNDKEYRIVKPIAQDKKCSIIEEKQERSYKIK